MEEHRYRRRAGITKRVLGAEVMLYFEDTESIHVLNRTSAFIWDFLENPASLDEIGAAVCNHFEVPEDANVAGDVRNVMEAFLNQGLVVKC